MPAFELDAFAENGILREQSVREAFGAYDWKQYRGKTVHIRGCGKVMIPTWAYLMAATHLSQVARRITFGEDKAPMLIFVPEDFKNRTASESPAESPETR